MRLTGWLVAIGLGTFLVWEHFGSDSNRLAAIRAEADSLALAADSLRVVVDSQRAADSLARDSLARQTARVRVAYRESQAQTDSAVAQVQDTNAVVELRRALSLERQAARQLLVQQDSTIAILTRQVAWRDRALEAKDVQLALSQRLLREALAAKRPSRFWRGAAVGAAVVAGVALLR